MESYFETDYGKLYNGHVLETLKALPSDMISCCITSPPYWALRDYGTDGVVWDGDADCEHEWTLEITKQSNMGGGKNGILKAKGKENYQMFVDYNDRTTQSNFCNKCGAWKGQLGLEPDFNLYIKHLCDIFDEVKRVLRKDGTCWVNLGDTYASSRGAGTSDNGTGSGVVSRRYADSFDFGRSGKNCSDALKRANNIKGRGRCPEGMEMKSLLNIPSRFSIEMQNRGWILRNKIIWHKPNCMPSSVTDRFTVDFEEIFFFVKNKKYWFEQQFEPHVSLEDYNRRTIKEKKGSLNHPRKDLYADSNGNFRDRGEYYGTNGRNMRTVWKIPTQPFPDAHFAVFPEKLVETPIKSGCPKEICTKCGKPRTPITGGQRTEICQTLGLMPYYETKCDCNAPFVAGIVLDPFMGSGTTAVYCEKNHYRWIGCEVSDKYCEMIKGRLEPYKMQKRLI